VWSTLIPLFWNEDTPYDEVAGQFVNAQKIAAEYVSSSGSGLLNLNMLKVLIITTK